MKRYVIVGAGASGLVASILLKKKHEDAEVLLLEQNDVYGKKLRTTGNGRCNIAPLKDDADTYNNKVFVERLFKEISLEEYLKSLEDLGIGVMNLKDQGFYPISLSANNVADILVNNAKSLGVVLIKDIFVDYVINDEIITVKGDVASYQCNKLILALGSNSGLSNKPIVKIDHGYKYSKFRPGLTAIKVFTNLHSLKDMRVQCSVSLVKGKKSFYREKGEVIFKEDGLSGICVMNCTNYIEEPYSDYLIVLNMWERPNVNVSFEMFDAQYKQLGNLESALLSYFNKLFIRWYLKGIEGNVDTWKVYEELSHLSFRVKTIEDFVRSQVTKGGLSVDEIDDKSFESKKEKNVYFLGEMLDINGLCGGYNLRFAITSAIALAKHIK